MTMIEFVANRIVELCREKNMALHALARNAGIPPSTVKNILNGASKNPGVATIGMICDGFGISLIEFFDTDAFRALEQARRRENNLQSTMRMIPEKYDAE